MRLLVLGALQLSASLEVISLEHRCQILELQSSLVAIVRFVVFFVHIDFPSVGCGFFCEKGCCKSGSVLF
jgi:hypothetical protein